MKSIRGLRSVVLCGIAFLLGCVLGCASEETRGSVVLITIDTLRADHLSGTGYAGGTSPVLDAFARSGTRFEWAFSTCSYTVPSHASIMVGRYPSFHSAGLLNGQQRLLPAETTLAEILREAGWQTAAIVSNAVLGSGSGFEQGFEHFDDVLPDRELVRRMPERRARDAVDRALARIGAFAGEPYFLWLHIQDPHGPYTPPPTTPDPVAPEGMNQSDRLLPVGRDFSGYQAIPAYQVVGDERRYSNYVERYDREIRTVDLELARLFEFLEESVRKGETLVVFTADHGEAMGEDGFYFSHGHSVGLDQVHVPLFFAGGGVSAGRTIEAPVSNMSVFATILDFLEQPRPERVQSPGLLASLVEGQAVPPAPVYTESHTQRGIAAAGHYFRRDRRPATDETFWRVSPISDGTIVPLGRALSRLAARGASEKRPLDRARPLVAALERQLDAFSRSAEEALGFYGARARPRELDPALREELRALGYGH